MQTLTVIIPTYNEENYIADCLQSVSFANQIIIVDSYSTDTTLQITKNYSCEVIQRKFDNFSNQKNAAIALAKSNWILFLDADERITEKLKIEILETINNATCSGYKLRFPHFYMNRFLYHTENKVLRLVKNENNIHFEGDVHEKLIIEGKIGVLKIKCYIIPTKGSLIILKRKMPMRGFKRK
jgi:glycosyltransferase involved in cell wall biosynthesis